MLIIVVQTLCIFKNVKMNFQSCKKTIRVHLQGNAILSFLQHFV